MLNAALNQYSYGLGHFVADHATPKGPPDLLVRRLSHFLATLSD
jgi:hypothetical protein